MRNSDCIAHAFEGGPADPDSDAEKARFFRQAYWLGKCAELVYPPDSSEFPDENRLDDEAEILRRGYRKLRPFWKVFFTKTPEQIEAEEKWRTAENVWAETARNRISKKVGDWWVPAGTPLSGGFLVKFLTCHGTQYFVARDENTIVVCFRGTEPKKRGDIFSDILSIQVSETGKQTGKIHLGFWTALDHVWHEETASGETLPELFGKNSLRDNGQRVWFTGHSLGGALATVAADRLLVTGKLKEKDIGAVFTFGQPRVGDQAFAQGYPLKDRHYRFVNNNDAVTRVPPKSLWFVSLIFGKFFKGAPAPVQTGSTVPVGTEPKSEKSAKKSALNFSDVGRIILANRSGTLKILEPGILQWRFQLFIGRLVSRFMALFKLHGVMNRSFPGLHDHSMRHYNEALELFDPAEHLKENSGQQRDD